jgi:hypothetical protein
METAGKSRHHKSVLPVLESIRQTEANLNAISVNDRPHAQCSASQGESLLFRF